MKTGILTAADFLQGQIACQCTEDEMTVALVAARIEMSQ
jgi:hypothetical protein